MATRNTTAAAASDAEIVDRLRKAGDRSRQADHGRLRVRDRGRFQGRPVAGHRRRPRQRKAHPRRAAPARSRTSLASPRRRSPPARVPAALGDCFILVDPLDGTREFVSRRPDFTVNIALIAQGRARYRRRLRAGARRDVLRLARACGGDRGRTRLCGRGAAGRSHVRSRRAAAHHRRQPLARHAETEASTSASSRPPRSCRSARR